METVLRALTIYLVLLLVFRLAGRRNLMQMTSFDFVLLLIISEATRTPCWRRLLRHDRWLAIVTPLGNILLSYWKHRSAAVDRWLDGYHYHVENGIPLKPLMDRARIDVEDVLAAARQGPGLERMEQIKYAVMEVGGHISVIPK